MSLPGGDGGRPSPARPAADSPARRAAGADVIQMGGRQPGGGGRWLRWAGSGGGRRAAAAAAAALGAGLLLGYLGGHLGTRAAGEPVPAGRGTSAAVPLAGPALDLTGARCAVQRGKTLQVGIEIVNESASAVTVRSLEPVLPLGGLRPVASAWGPCGALAGPGAPALAPGATAWLTMTFDVLVGCPGPLPVEFRVGYAQSGHPATAVLDGFPDLGQVSYSGCPAGP